MRIHLLVDKQVVHDDLTHDLYFNITADDGRRFRVKTDIRCEQKPVGLLFPRTERNSVAKSARLRDLYDQIEEFGTFYASIRSKGAEGLDKFNVGEHITGVCMRFLPARSEGNDSITLRKSAQFKSTAEMANAEQLNAAASNNAQGGGE